MFLLGRLLYSHEAIAFTPLRSIRAPRGGIPDEAAETRIEPVGRYSGERIEVAVQRSSHIAFDF